MNNRTSSKPSERQQHVLQEILPLAEFTEDCVHLQTGMYLDLLQIVTKDLLNISEDALVQDNTHLQSVYKTYTDDLKLIAVNFPKDTKLQQEYFQRLISHERNPYYRREQQVQLEQLQALERNNTEREYYLMYFATTLEDLNHKQLTLLSGFQPGQVRKLTPRKKKEILYKLNNKNSRVFV